MEVVELARSKVGKSGRRKRGGWPSPSAWAVTKRPRRGLGGNIVLLAVYLRLLYGC